MCQTSNFIYGSHIGRLRIGAVGHTYLCDSCVIHLRSESSVNHVGKDAPSQLPTV